LSLHVPAGTGRCERYATGSSSRGVDLP
jgi:hypothetical protein